MFCFSLPVCVQALGTSAPDGPVHFQDLTAVAVTTRNKSNRQEKNLKTDSLKTILSMKESPKPELPQVTCPRSTRSLNHQSAGVLNGSHDSGRESWTGAGSDGSRPDS